jgi:hypothetical protein
MRLKYLIALALFAITPAHAETLKGHAGFLLGNVQAFLENGSPSTDPEQQQACRMIFAGTGSAGDLDDGILDVTYDINKETYFMTATAEYRYAGSKTAELDNFSTLGLKGVFAFMDTSKEGVLYDDYGVFRVVFELGLDGRPLSAFMMVPGEEGVFNCILWSLLLKEATK